MFTNRRALWILSPPDCKSFTELKSINTVKRTHIQQTIMSHNNASPGRSYHSHNQAPQQPSRAPHTSQSSLRRENSRRESPRRESSRRESSHQENSRRDSGGSTSSSDSPETLGREAARIGNGVHVPPNIPGHPQTQHPHGDQPRRSSNGSEFADFSDEWESPRGEFDDYWWPDPDADEHRQPRVPAPSLASSIVSSTVSVLDQGSQRGYFQHPRLSGATLVEDPTLAARVEAAIEESRREHQAAVPARETEPDHQPHVATSQARHEDQPARPVREPRGPLTRAIERSDRESQNGVVAGNRQVERNRLAREEASERPRPPANDRRGPFRQLADRVRGRRTSGSRQHEHWYGHGREGSNSTARQSSRSPTGRSDASPPVRRRRSWWERHGSLC